MYHSTPFTTVTEVNYGMGLFAIFNSFIDREKLWTSLAGDVLPAFVSSYLPAQVLGMQLKHLGLSGWYVTSSILVLGSFFRVLTNESVKTHKLQWSAVSKLATPFLIAVGPFLLPFNVIEKETRALLVSTGLLMSFLTCKMICFSMAKQSYASIQMESFPFFAVMILIKTDATNHQILTDTMVTSILAALCVWYAYRLVNWSSKAIHQICLRLDINCLTIKHPKTKAA